MWIGTDDIASAYRLIPTSQPYYNVICAVDPDLSPESVGGNVRFFVVPGHPFGLTSAVLNFNRVPRLAVYFARMILGVLTNSFYDDCVIVEPSFCARSGQECMQRIMQLIGMPFSEEKHEPVAPASPFLGVISDFTKSYTHGIMQMAIKPERRESLLALLDKFINELALTRAEAASLEGKILFCVLSQFGRVGRAAVSLVREHALHAPSPRVDETLEHALCFLYDLIRDLKPFEAPMYPPRQQPLLVWTDAMFESRDGLRLDAPELGCQADIGVIAWCPRERCLFTTL